MGEEGSVFLSFFLSSSSRNSALEVALMVLDLGSLSW